MACKNGICNLGPAVGTNVSPNQNVTAIKPPEGSFWKGTPGGFSQLPIYPPEVQTALTQLLQQGISGIQARKPFDFGPIKEQAVSDFRTEGIPTLAERFTAMGGGQRSSAFEGALGSAEGGLRRDLASLESQYNLQQQGQDDTFFQNLLRLGLVPRSENLYFPSSPGALQGLAQGAGQAAGTGLSLLFKYLTGGLA